jgi:uridylate kinase
MSEKLKYKRILLKLSGEMLAGDNQGGIDPVAVSGLVDSVTEVFELGVQIGVVIGGGNIFRGIKAGTAGLERTTGDYMGMLGTAINSLALQDIIEHRGIPTRVMSAIDMSALAEPYIRRRAHRHLEKGRLVIFACGTGNPYFSTDTAATLRAMEMNAEVVLKGTKVDFVYDKDPVGNPDAKPFEHVSYMEVLQKKLAVMDAAAISMCMENSLPIIVFNMGVKDNLKKIVVGEAVGTFVS